MRTRTRGSGPITYIAVADNYSNGVHHYGAPVPWKCTTALQRFVDDPHGGYVRTPYGFSVRKFNSCGNERYSVSPNTGNESMQTSSSNTLYTSLPTCILWYWGSGPTDDLGEWMYSKLGGYLSTELSNGRTYYDHWCQAKPGLGSRANMAVFLYELRDIKRMFDVLPSKHLTATLSGRSRVTVRTWREAIRYLNGNVHLNYNFGWKPFVRDIRNVFDGLDTFEKRLKRFVDESNQLLTRHVPDSPIYQEISYLSPIAYGWRYQLSGAYTFQKISTFQMAYQNPYSGSELRWRGYLDTLGLNPSIKNMWAVVPWSFVVDWFFNVGRLLDSDAANWVQPWIDLFQACHSWRFAASMKVDCQYVGYSGNSMKPVGEITCVRYKREAGIPSATADTSQLNADKIRLLASLGLSLII